MTDALTLGTMSPEIRKVVDRARAEPEGRFHSLAHLIDVPALAAAYWRIRKDAAVGVDGVTKDQYGQDLERNLQDLYGPAEVQAVSASADSSGAHPQRRRSDTTDWDFGA